MRLLLLSYHFAPDPSVASDRPNSLYKHAKANDVSIDVLTTACAPQAPTDLCVIRLDSTQTWTRPGEMLRKLPFKAATKCIEPFLLNIDTLWYRNAVRWFRDVPPDRYDAIYAVFPTATAALLGRTMSRMSGLPLVTDFTDTIAYAPIYPQHALQRLTQRMLERSIVEQSRCIVTIARGFEDYFRQTYPSSRIATIYNGYDEDDFSLVGDGRDQTHTRGRVRIAHFGNICASRKRNVLPLFEGIKRASERTKAEIEFVFIGRYTAYERRMVSRLGLNSLVRFHPHMEKRQGLKMLHDEFDYLLFYGVPGERAAVCSKLLEYLRVGRPIVGVCRGNEAESIIERARAGECAGFATESVAALLQKAARRQVHFDLDQEFVGTFDRRRQAADIFAFIEANR